MRVFLSWSGGRSRAVAEAFGRWLGLAIQAVDPWMSPDIRKGTRWLEELEKALDESKVGVFFVTKGSLVSPWLHFEAGALSRSKDTLICCFLIDVSAEALHFLPLEQFQQTTSSEDDVKRLLVAINNAVATANERTLSETRLNEAFQNSWPTLRKRLTAIQNATYEDEVTDPAAKSFDVMGIVVATVLSEAAEGGISGERLALNIARSMPIEGSKDLDLEHLTLLVSVIQDTYLPKLMRSGYVKKEGDLYTLTDGGRSHFAEEARKRAALQKKLEDMLRQKS